MRRGNLVSHMGRETEALSGKNIDISVFGSFLNM